jgi:hypothetical protein
MNGPKAKVVTVTVAFLALATVLVWRQWRIKRLMEDAAGLREQVEQAAMLRDDNRRLAEQLRLASERSEADLSELRRLRGQSVRGRQTEQDSVRLKAERDRPGQQPTSHQRVENDGSWNTPDEAAARPSSAGLVCSNNLFSVSSALLQYAAVHQSYLPTNLMSLRGYLSDPTKLVCPADTIHPKPVSTNWEEFDATMITYRIVFSKIARTNEAHKQYLFCRPHENVILNTGQVGLYRRAN